MDEKELQKIAERISLLFMLEAFMVEKREIDWNSPLFKQVRELSDDDAITVLKMVSDNLKRIIEGGPCNG